ncbi:S8 family serine peptidase [Microvirga sp. STR05]|uniref:S8 family serine peptidase n=1 Tax=Hymenobacter duratus TaxID=2771356 RepID=A0ABR8JCT5_9BACT|nr:S8 family serine peptidase [Hymenobacter duratus]MBD2714615.1 S8 family serine peptidase [Hymenobacter duratus]MBR7949519.1 S8 family serine peptidase [Microvirga sp. STR05]
MAPTARQTVRVQTSNAAAFRQWARQELPGAILRAETGQPHIFQLSGISQAQLQLLVASPLVAFIDAADRRPHDERQLNQANLNVNSVTPLHRRYPALAGQGLTVSVKENPLDVTDIDFKGRLVNIDPAAVTVSSHATTMATLIAGGGNSAPAGRGVAWQARITSSDYVRLLPDDGVQLQQRNVSVQNHSYGTGIENYYGLESQAYDTQAQQYPTLLHVFSSGNSGAQTSPTGPYQGLPGVANLTGQFKMSKNTLSVGATDALGQVAAMSSRGPAYDGRIKPELVAFGDEGSSDAAALVSGMSLLVQQTYRDQNGGVLPPSALVKAALLNSADDTGRSEVDFVAGFGQADALGAVRTMLDRRYFQGSVGQGQATQFTLVVPPGTQQLKLTLAWTDPAAAANASSALLNDLDVLLTNNGTSWRPWTLSTYPHPDSLALPARRRPDHLNNVEQITLAAPAPGTYQIAVRGYTVATGPQAFSVAYELNNGFEWLTPNKMRNVRPGEATQLRWQWAGPAAAGQLEYRPVGATTWRRISSGVDLAARTYTWAAPDTTTLAQVRMVSASGTIVSDTFALARPLPLTIGYSCPDEALLYWPRVPGAAQYQQYRLGATHMEPVTRTSDTTYVLTGAALAVPQYAVAPVLRGQVAERGSSINRNTAGFDCYIRSFIGRQPVADTVQLLVELGSTFRLQSLKLQRLEQGEFRTILTQSPVTQLRFTLTDASAPSGLNQYRLELQDSGGRVFHSRLESVYQVSQPEVLVFPVPATAGTPLSIIGPPDTELRLRLFDTLGRLLHESTATGTINHLSTSALKPGTYLLRIGAGDGPEITRRILVL